MASRQKIKTFLWFDKEAEEAAKFYTSIFENSRITGSGASSPPAARRASAAGSRTAQLQRAHRGQ